MPTYTTAQYVAAINALKKQNDDLQNKLISTQSQLDLAQQKLLDANTTATDILDNLPTT